MPAGMASRVASPTCMQRLITCGASVRGGTTQEVDVIVDSNPSLRPAWLPDAAILSAEASRRVRALYAVGSDDHERYGDCLHDVCQAGRSILAFEARHGLGRSAVTKTLGRYLSDKHASSSWALAAELTLGVQLTLTTLMWGADS